METDYSISPARYAKGMVAISTASNNGYKSRACCLAADGLGLRWSGRDRAYIASPSQAARFERLHRYGFDANFFSGEIDNREAGLRDLDWRTADKVALWMDAQDVMAWCALEAVAKGDAIFNIGQLEPEGVAALDALAKAKHLHRGRAHWNRCGPLKTYWERHDAARLRNTLAKAA